MEKSPIKQLFDSLIEHESLTVTFDSARDMETTKVRLHQIRKEVDRDLSILGEESVFGTKSIRFTQLSELTYKIHLQDIRSAARAKFQIISTGDNNEDVSANLD